VAFVLRCSPLSRALYNSIEFHQKSLIKWLSKSLINIGSLMSAFDMDSASVKQYLALLKPFISIAFALLAVILITCIGIYLSIKFDDWLWFARSGAAIVTISLLLASTNHSTWADSFVDILDTVTKSSTKDEVKQIVQDSVERSFKRHNVELAENELAYHTSKEIGLLTQQSKEILVNLAHKKFVRFEFTIAAYGTLIWGFGDLLGAVV